MMRAIAGRYCSQVSIGVTFAVDNVSKAAQKINARVRLPEANATHARQVSIKTVTA